MPWTINYIFVLIGTFLIAIVTTPLVRSLALRVGAVDNPNARRINKKPMPSAGGLAIFLAFVLATLVFMPMIIQKDVWHISYFRYILPVAVGGAIVVLTGFIDDIFELKPLEKQDLIRLIDRTLTDQKRGLGNEKIIIDEDAKNFLADMASGDARSVLNALELAYLTTDKNKEGKIHISLEVAEECIQKKAIRYDKSGDNHYDAISAFIESMKHTEPDATLYYLARMLIAGEDVKYIARRICVCASEDIGLANSQALVVATNAFLAVERIGMPEAAKILAHAALYACCSPKSDTVSRGITQAMADAKQTTNVPIPPFLQDASYKNAQKLGRGVGLDNIHAFKNHYSGKKCMPKELSNRHYFQLTQMGNEKSIQKFLDYLRENRNN